MKEEYSMGFGLELNEIWLATMMTDVFCNDISSHLIVQELTPFFFFFFEVLSWKDIGVGHVL
jgi:hypothetical protein